MARVSNLHGKGTYHSKVHISNLRGKPMHYSRLGTVLWHVLLSHKLGITPYCHQNWLSSHIALSNMSGLSGSFPAVVAIMTRHPQNGIWLNLWSIKLGPDQTMETTWRKLAENTCPYLLCLQDRMANLEDVPTSQNRLKDYSQHLKKLSPVTLPTLSWRSDIR